MGISNFFCLPINYLEVFLNKQKGKKRQFINFYQNKQKVGINFLNKRGKRLSIMASPRIYEPNFEDELSENGRRILKLKYLRTMSDGSLETGNQFVRRVAHAVANGDYKLEKVFYQALFDKMMIPNTPCLINAGMPYEQLSACFVLDLTDNLGSEKGGIFNTLREAALIQQTGGGVGYNFGKLRAKGSLVASSGGQSSGPVSFLGVYDKAFGSIAQGGCLTPDTLVFTDKGMLHLHEIVDSNTPGWQTHSLSVPTDQGTKFSPRCFNNGVAPIISIKLTNGHTICGTYNHKVKCFKSDSETEKEWKELKDLKMNDRILGISGLHQGVKQILKPLLKEGSSSAWINLPEFFDESFAEWLGMIHGHRASEHLEVEDHDYLSITVNRNSFLAQHFVSLTKKSFRAAFIRYPDDVSDSSITILPMDEKIVKEFLQENGLIQGNPSEMILPAIVRKSPPEIAASYIRGIYETMGCIDSNDLPAIYTFSEEFAKELSILLIGLGVPNIFEEYPVERENSVRFSRGLDMALCSWGKRIGCHPESEIFKKSNKDGILSPKMIEQHCLPIGYELSFYVSEIKHHTMSCPTMDLEVDENHTYIANGVVTHNTRRGANMACMPISHPDIEEFIDCKKGTENVNTNFNLSVMFDDVFMKTLLGENPNKNPVGHEYDFSLIHPNTGKVAKVIDARELYEHICQNAWSNGEPGVLFPDTANKDNMIINVAKLEATNPCGEIWLTPYESCCLAHLNLPAHFSDDALMFDIDKLEETIKTTVTFLDNMLTKNKFISSIPELSEAARNYRRIGLGITGFHDFLIRLGKPYDTSSIPLIEDLMKFIYYTALKQSVELAKTRGPFAAIKGSLWDPDYKGPGEFGGRILNTHISNQSNTIPTLSTTRTLDWEGLKDDIIKYGVRNSHLLAIAPTGTTSSLIGVEGYGCEPIFSPSYTRTLGSGGTLKYISRLYKDTLEKQEDWMYGYVPIAYQQKVIDYIVENGRLPPANDPQFENAPINERTRKVLSCSAPEVSPLTHILIQAAFQKSVDNSISKTVNLPNSATVEEIKEIYMAAWSHGLKGVTVYRASSRQFEPLKAPTTTTTTTTTTTDTATNASIVSGNATLVKGPDPSSQTTTTEVKLKTSETILTQEVEKTVIKKPRPTLLKGCTIKKPTGFGDVFVTVNKDSNGEPFETFITFGKSGEDLQAITEALGRLISLNLREIGGISPKEKLTQIIEQLEGIGGRFTVRDKDSHGQIRSIPDSIAHALKLFMDEYNDEPTEVVSEKTEPTEEVLSQPSSNSSQNRYDLCPECHQATLIRSEHCLRCTHCSYSRC